MHGDILTIGVSRSFSADSNMHQRRHGAHDSAAHLLRKNSFLSLTVNFMVLLAK